MRASTENFKIKEHILSEEQIKNSIKSIAHEIDTYYQHNDIKEIILLIVLNGAMYFGVDLSRELNTNHQIECIRVSSYGNSKQSSGSVKILDSIRLDLEEKHVLIVDEILDTGNTLHSLEGLVKGLGASSVKICTLLERDINRPFLLQTINTTAKISKDKFLVGYGLDYNGYYRNKTEIVDIEI